MGARTTIRIKQEYNKEAVHYYSHWGGDEIHKILAEGLQLAKRAGRLDDEAYASRIIFDTLVQSGLPDNPDKQWLDHHRTHGFGIIIGDNRVPFDIGYATPCVEWVGNNISPALSSTAQIPKNGEPIIYTLPLEAYEGHFVDDTDLGMVETYLTHNNAIVQVYTVDEFISKYSTNDLTLAG